MCCLSFRPVAGKESLPEHYGWGKDKGRSEPRWLFSAGRVAFYSRNAGSVKTERWLFSNGLRTRRLYSIDPHGVAELRSYLESFWSSTLEPIRRSILVHCSVEHAFRVFTEQMSTWWPLDTHSRAVDEEIEGVTAVGVHLEPRAGGRIQEELSNGQMRSWGQILAWDPPGRLVIAWKPNSNPLPPTELEVTFSAEGGGTRVVLEHRGWERRGEGAERARAGYDRGWAVVFDKLYAEAVARGGG